MHLGLMNTPATFMDLMNRLNRTMLDRSVTFIIDDIMVYSKSCEEHEGHEGHVRGLLGTKAIFLVARSSVSCSSHQPRRDFTLSNQGRCHIGLGFPKTPTDIGSFL